MNKHLGWLYTVKLFVYIMFGHCADAKKEESKTSKWRNTIICDRDCVHSPMCNDYHGNHSFVPGIFHCKIISSL